jgi:hypothetical protein
MNEEFLKAIRASDVEAIRGYLRPLSEDRKKYVLNAPIAELKPSLDPKMSGVTLLQFSIQCGGLGDGHEDRKVSEFLVAQGANVNGKNPNTGITPLMEAARYDGAFDPNVGVKKLLHLRADSHATDNEGATALDWAKHAAEDRLTGAKQAMSVTPNSTDLQQRYKKEASVDSGLIQTLENAEHGTRTGHSMGNVGHTGRKSAAASTPTPTQTVASRLKGFFGSGK